uniref:Potassium channel domain-containing protein n=1 Tax=viral metagenome TaxID=1070528 RepID=A0A6C0KRJ5_9ZZZZ
MLSFKLTQLFFVMTFCIIIFGNAYANFFGIKIEDALYMALRIQTMSGSDIEPISPEHKILMSFQYILAYLVTSGLIILSINI